MEFQAAANGKSPWSQRANAAESNGGNGNDGGSSSSNSSSELVLKAWGNSNQTAELRIVNTEGDRQPKRKLIKSLLKKEARPGRRLQSQRIRLNRALPAN